MTDSEIQGIRQSVEDGYFERHGEQPRESEINACLRFFKQVDIIKATKNPEDVNQSEEFVIGIFNRVMDRDVLISGFDSEKGEPKFIKNDICKQ